jgi:hypothetical protein
VKYFRWQIALGASLLISSFVFYLVHYIFIGSISHIFESFIDNIAFLPIQALLVTLILSQVLGQREKQARLEKLNTVVGAFFSEVGTRLLTWSASADPCIEEIRAQLLVTAAWSERDFRAVSAQLYARTYAVTIERIHLGDLRAFLVGERGFLLGLMQSPTLLEHESFTELLRAVFHLTEELEARPDLSALPPADLAHLAVDMQRAYKLIMQNWLVYMRHLKDNYPYLFSLAMRMNPFDRDASPIVRQVP